MVSRARIGKRPWSRPTLGRMAAVETGVRSRRGPGLAGVLLILGLVITGCGGSGSSSTSGKASNAGGGTPAQPNVSITFFEHNAPLQDQIIATDPALQKPIPAHLRFVPVGNGPSALAGYRAGSFQMVSSIGDPPVVGAVAAGTKFQVIWPETLDDAELVVQPGINSVQDLAGKTVAVLLGSSEDYELRGLLAHFGLTSKVHVLNVTSSQDMVPAFNTHRIDGAYDDVDPFVSQMTKTGGHVLNIGGNAVSATYIASLGYASYNSASVSDAFAHDHPDVVQAYACALYKATQIMHGPKGPATAAFTRTSSITGLPASQAVKSGFELPVPAAAEVPKLLANGGNYEVGLMRASQYLAKAGNIKAPLTHEQVASHVNASWATNALAGKCG